MNKLIPIALLVLFSLNAFSQVRGVTFGQSQKSVKAKETAKLAKDEPGTLTYNTKIAGLSTSLIYSFDNDELITVFYYFDGDYINSNHYIRDYENLKRQLEQKYGEPDDDKIDWNKTLYKDSPEDYGLAVSAGHLSYNAIWYVDDEMIISISLKGENFSSYIAIMYMSEEFLNREPQVDPGL